MLLPNGITVGEDVFLLFRGSEDAKDKGVVQGSNFWLRGDVQLVVVVLFRGSIQGLSAHVTWPHAPQNNSYLRDERTELPYS